MDERLFWRIAAKYFAGEATEREIESLQAWIASDPARRELFSEAREAWEHEGKKDTVSVDALSAWKSLERRIDRDVAAPRLRPDVRHKDRSGREPRRSRHSPARWRPGMTVGGMALLLIAVFAALLWPDTPDRVIATATGERVAVDLADGTRVHLNAKSRLTIESLSGSTRQVHLEGEAFFEVAHDEARPFLVHTHEGIIRVVGTAFDVNAYTDEQRMSVAVTEGAVALHVKAATPTDADTVVLRPRQLGVVTGQRLLELHRDVDLTPHLAWREGRLVFEDTPFPEVTRRLERWYSLEIETDSLDSVDRLNAVFDHEAARNVLDDIALALGLQYDRDGDSVRFYR